MQGVMRLPATAEVPWRRAVTAVPWVALLLVGWALGAELNGPDARTYHAVDLAHLYDSTELGIGGFMYSPAAGQAFAAVGRLPFDAFNGLLLCAELVALGYLIGPWLALGAVALQVPLVWDDLVWGNLQLSAAALVVLALRHASLYAPLLLTKVTPGIGIVYHLARREWRHVAVAAGVTAGIVALSALTIPGAWGEWIGLLAASGGDATPNRMAVPFVVRVPLALALTAYAGLTGKAWLVPIAAAVASPEGGPHWLLALGAIPLLRTAGSKPRP